MAETDAEKTEDPTPERRRKAREEGQFPRARDSGATIGSLAVLMVLMGLGQGYLESVRAFAHRCFSDVEQLMQGEFTAAFQALAKTLAMVTLPTAAAAAAGGIAAGLVEAGYRPQIELAFPKWSRLAPLNKLKTMFSPKDASVSVALQASRVAVVGTVAYVCVKDALPGIIRLSRSSLNGALSAAGAALFNLAVYASLALLVLVVVDYLYNWKRHETQLRMSRQEVRDEMKQQEGDPRVRARQRARAREMLKRGLVQAVKESDLIVVNPTHVSVAIRYRVHEGAPIVAAKGYDEIALHIRKLAREQGLPIIENVALARELARRVKVGRAIPIELYATVAEVLAFVYRLKNKLSRLPAG